MDPSCLFTEKLYDFPLNYLEQMRKSHPSMQKRKNPQKNTDKIVNHNSCAYKDPNASRLPMKKKITPIYPALLPPNLPPATPLIHPPRDAPQPKATLQYPAQRFMSSGGVSLGIMWVIYEIWMPQQSPSITKRQRIEYILGQYLNISVNPDEAYRGYAG